MRPKRCKYFYNKVKSKSTPTLNRHHSIGTVKKCRKAVIEKQRHRAEDTEIKLKRYEEIGTVDDFEKAMEKQTAKEVKVEDLGNQSYVCNCPECGMYFGSIQRWYLAQTKCCSNCGQKLKPFSIKK